MKKDDFLRRYNNPDDDMKDLEGLVQTYELSVDYGIETESLFEKEGEAEKTTESRL